MFGTESATPRGVAIQLLARREYSRAELVDRLVKKSFEADDIQACLDALEEQGLQSDTRFAESFVRTRILRGQGVIRIKQELRLRGVNGEMLAAAIAEVERQECIDWFELAAEACQRRFGESVANLPPKERARRERFLANRGFDFDQIRHALSPRDA
ncbi:regulatory protein RecX [Vreelandella malpeensis]|uniref:Regulatory protein RecX n=1 Tax=Vreelandella malpeensis TaxID=1172368 RepID=A0ABS8DRI9_9GAMM|nr:regulatory protein RecX [Halomonas malpeensis]MCB8888937.1 regulatory protein RecX [Halomonas malpeensis]